jgi:sugar (pentulose or hexulose) kinase
MRLPVMLIFDVGKTNKKILLFDDEYKIVYKESIQIEETKDEDGFPCEDVNALTRWVKDSFHRLVQDKRFEIRGVNFSGYGASFVYLDETLNVCLPLYNYLKPYPAELKQRFYNTYGGEEKLATQTASPVLGSLNSGMQLYRLKNERPEVFSKIKYALHLPQYLSFILSSNTCSEITSIGCHTNLWDFQKNNYHKWVTQEGIEKKLAPVMHSNETAGYASNTIPVGVGLHDSSAALIPYLAAFDEPFILVSTGTWCINLNPFNHSPLTQYELQQDCLCYLTTDGKPVKASRLFTGYEHEQQVKKLAAQFHKAENYFETARYDIDISASVQSLENIDTLQCGDFKNYEEAYHYLIAGMINKQVKSMQLVLNEKAPGIIFVDGGFSKNSIYIQLLANAFPLSKIYTGFSSEASALGAAIAFGKNRSNKDLLQKLIKSAMMSYS